jgi:hypothetical protein
MALCFECGAMYEGLTLPDDFDEIEQILTQRPHARFMHWTNETLDELRAENIERGFQTGGA